jgi:hypothetical protein
VQGGRILAASREAEMLHQPSVRRLDFAQLGTRVTGPVARRSYRCGSARR